MIVVYGLDLPSLTSILCQDDSESIHQYIGRVILESMVWFISFISFIDIPNLTYNNIIYGRKSFYYTADLQATSNFIF